MISIFINNEKHSIEEHSSVADVLSAHGFESDRIAVAINKHFVARSNYTHQIVHDNDMLDIVSPVQGG